MKVYFVGQYIPSELMNQYFEQMKNLTDVAANNFYNALLNGFQENGEDVSCSSQVPENLLSVCNREKKEQIQVHYRKYETSPLKRFFKNFLYTVSSLNRWNNKNSDKFVIFNVLRLSQVIGGLLFCKLRKIPTVGIVTDVPGYRIQTIKARKIRFQIVDRIGQYFLGQYDCYVFLSEEMKNIKSFQGKKSVVVEGIYHSHHEVSREIEPNNSGKFNIMYAGSLEYKYGVMELVKAVLMLKEPARLMIYGKGEAQQEIERIAREDDRIYYGGVVSNEKILHYERGADLLVNPRPVKEEYVKYSFPSKNIEYMASGTPVLLTEIPSLPKEYKEYVYIAADGKSEMLAEQIENIIQLPLNERKCKGEKARKFILEKKSPLEQSGKIVKMMRRNYKSDEN